MNKLFYMHRMYNVDDKCASDILLFCRKLHCYPLFLVMSCMFVYCSFYPMFYIPSYMYRGPYGRLAIAFEI